MPLGKNVTYRYKKNSHIRLAFKNGNVIEAKNMKTGNTHTPKEFADDKKKNKHDGRTWAMKRLGLKKAMMS